MSKYVKNVLVNLTRGQASQKNQIKHAAIAAV